MQSLKKKTQGFTSLSQKNKGFTIIEVMIVLVIAAVIILIVFLAVPALQRNSRNNQRKSHAARLLSAANEYRSNNTNAYPSTATQVTDLAGSGGFYDAANIAVTPATTATLNITNEITGAWIFRTHVYIFTQASCVSSTSIGPGNGVAAVYYNETGGSTVRGQCI